MIDKKGAERGLKELNKHIKTISKGACQLGGDRKCRLAYENINIYIAAFPAADLVIFKSFINFVPEPATGKVLPLYYHLLDMNDEVETLDAYFAIVSGEEIGRETDVVSVEVKRPLTDISFLEFTRCLISVGEVSNKYIRKLATEFQAPPVP